MRFFVCLFILLVFGTTLHAGDEQVSASLHIDKSTVGVGSYVPIQLALHNKGASPTFVYAGPEKSFGGMLRLQISHAPLKVTGDTTAEADKPVAASESVMVIQLPPVKEGGEDRVRGWIGIAPDEQVLVPLLVLNSPRYPLGPIGKYTISAEVDLEVSAQPDSSGAAANTQATDVEPVSVTLKILNTEVDSLVMFKVLEKGCGWTAMNCRLQSNSPRPDAWKDVPHNDGRGRFADKDHLYELSRTNGKNHVVITELKTKKKLFEGDVNTAKEIKKLPRWARSVLNQNGYPWKSVELLVRGRCKKSTDMRENGQIQFFPLSRSHVQSFSAQNMLSQ